MKERASATECSRPGMYDGAGVLGDVGAVQGREILNREEVRGLGLVNIKKFYLLA